MRSRARVVVIGGGVAGASIAYHLAGLGWTDTVVVERDELTSGSTFHSAGLVGQLRSSVTLTRMMMYGTELYRRLGTETGQVPGWKEVGSLRLASSPARRRGVAAPMSVGRRRSGCHSSSSTTGEAHELFHGLFDPAGVLGAAFLPTDGQVNPSDLTMALAAGARAKGVELVTGIEGGRDRRGRARPAGARSPASRPTRGRSSVRSSSTPAGCTATRSGGWRGSRCRLCRWPTSTRSRAHVRSCPDRRRPCATPTAWSTSAKRSAG